MLFSSANGVVAKKGSVAYDTSKSAINHLVRELAVEFAPLARVNGLRAGQRRGRIHAVPPGAVISSLRKYNVTFDENETTEALRDKLSQFYAGRTLLKKKVTPADVAEAVFLLVSRRLPLTTGQILPVNSGLTEAFLR